MTRRDLIQNATALAMAAAVPAKSANDRIQIGVIGCGARSHELMNALLKVEGARIVGLVDGYKGRIARALDRTGNTAKVYAHYKEVLADKSIDAVVIATPDHWHKRMVVDAVEAGKDVYCEKPLTYRTSDGPEIIAAANRTKRIVQVGSQGIS